jgi:glycosyltransferase involved in cell wall biosynthesis
LSTPLATIVIRTKDEEESLPRLLEILARQTVADSLETIVVDSGSRDRTVAIARAAGSRVIEISPAEFTFGRALNIGTAAGAGPLTIALSAHAFPREDDWAERLLEVFADERVSCACGADADPSGRPFEGLLLQDIELARLHPTYGYSNGAGAYRTELWQRRPFREDMPGTEDKEWAWHWLSEGWLVAFAQHLTVDHSHARDPFPAVFDRARREWIGFGMYLDLPSYPIRTLIREWWSQDPQHDRSRMRARADPWRAARLLGKYSAFRAT